MTTLNFKNLIDLPEWRPLTPPLITQTAGCSICDDMRNSEDANPNIFYLVGTNLYKYNQLNDGWIPVLAHTLSGVSAGSTCVFVPHKGPQGTIQTSTSTTKLTLRLSASLSAGLRQNAFADNGSGRGFKIRIVGLANGKTEERLITSSTKITAGSDLVTVTLDSALSSGFVANDLFEVLSGQVWMLGSGTAGTNTWKVYDIVTETLTAMSRTNLTASISVDSSLISLSESYVPYNRKPGEGFCVDGSATYNSGSLKCLVATAAGASSLTGQASNGDAIVTANLFRNFQIRIVEDTVNTTAVGQRRRISSHTAGASPVYTLASAWTVTPSANAKYVIEYPGSLILGFTSATTYTFTYAIDNYNGDTADTWSTTRFGQFTTSIGGGVCVFGGFSLDWTADLSGETRPGFIYLVKASGTSTIDCLDISGGANGSWETGATTVPYAGKISTFNTGTCGAHDCATNQGKYFYLSDEATQSIFRFNMLTRELEPWTFVRVVSPSVSAGNRMAVGLFVDGDTKVTFLYYMPSNLQAFYSCLLQR